MVKPFQGPSQEPPPPSEEPGHNCVLGMNQLMVNELCLSCSLANHRDHIVIYIYIGSILHFTLL